MWEALCALEAVLDESHLARGLEAPLDPLEHGPGLLELVVHVHHDDPVESALGQPGVGIRAEHGLDARDPFLLHVIAQEVQHLRLDVDGVDAAARRHHARHAPCEPPRAAAEVGRHVAALEPEGPEDLRRALLGLAVLALQPGGAVEGHDPRGRPFGQSGGRLEEKDGQESEGRLVHC